MGRWGILAILCLAAACSAKDEGTASNAAAARPHAKPVQPAVQMSAARAGAGFEDSQRLVLTPATHMGTWYKAGAYRVRSRVPTVSIAPTADLPVIAYEKLEEFCYDDAEPETPEGKWARSRGWRVAKEGRLGPLTVLSVARKYHYVGPQTTCVATDGRFLLFSHGRPVASIVTQAVQGFQFNFFVKTGRGAVRLYTETSEKAPYGDLVLKGRDLEIEPLPPTDTVCNGRRTVPNIFGKEIERARRILRRAGWKPFPMYRRRPVFDEYGIGDWNDTDDVYFDGLTEVISCDTRTHCNFGYRSRGVALKVSTFADSVVWYEANCAGKQFSDVY